MGYRRERLMSQAAGWMKMSMGESRAPSPTITFISRRRHARGRRRVWTPLPQYPGLGQMANPIPYPPQVNFSSTSPNESYPDGSPTSPISLTSSTHPSPVGTSTPGDSSCCPSGTGQHGWCINISTPTPVVNPVVPAAVPVIVAGGPPDLSPPPPPGSGPGSVADFRQHVS